MAATSKTSTLNPLKVVWNLICAVFLFALILLIAFGFMDRATKGELSRDVGGALRERQSSHNAAEAIEDLDSVAVALASYRQKTRDLGFSALVTGSVDSTEAREDFQGLRGKIFNVHGAAKSPADAAVLNRLYQALEDLKQTTTEMNDLMQRYEVAQKYDDAVSKSSIERQFAGAVQSFTSRADTFLELFNEQRNRLNK